MPTLKDIRIVGLFLVLLGMGADLLAQNFTATVNKNTVAMGENFKLTYSLDDKAEQFYQPDLRNFRILSGPNQSTSMSYTNGQMSSSTSFTYILTPAREGQYTIAPAQIKANGKMIASNDISINVTKQSQNQSNAQNQQNTNNNTQSNEIKDNCFIRLLISKNEAYQGEQLIATFKIFTRLSIVDNAVDQMPSFTGFYSEEINDPAQGNLKPEIINGVQFNTAIIKQVVLSPQRSGKLKIEPMSMDLVIRVRDDRQPRSVFDQFFGAYKDIRYKAVSNGATISVKPLPSEGKPADFSGAVGTFTSNATIDKQEVKENEAINLKVTYSGKGNIKLISDPEFVFPTDFEVYDPKKNTNIKTGLAGVQGSKTYEYLIIPRHAGNFTIPSASFTYFDPSSKKYVTQQTPVFNINVLRGDGQPATVSDGGIKSVSKKDVTLLGKDIRFIKKGNPRLTEANSYFMGSRLFWLLIIGPSVLLIILMLARKRIMEMQADVTGMRKRRATKIAGKRLAAARKHMENGLKNEFYEEIFKSLNGYISDKFNIALADLSKESIAETLELKMVSKEVINQFLNVLSECEMARFAPSAAMSESEVYASAEQIINQIEEEIK